MKIVPIMSIRNDKPKVFIARDQGTQHTSGQTRTLGRGMLIGMLGNTYKDDIIVNI